MFPCTKRLFAQVPALEIALLWLAFHNNYLISPHFFWLPRPGVIRYLPWSDSYELSEPDFAVEPKAANLKGPFM